ncbi:MAG: O-antigen ligase family protein [Planctomycetota bacterium]|nr:O-antigen ligase family protein [Planctomycetota bacterium]
MSGLSSAPQGREWTPTAALVLCTAAPVVYGCQPPWASGFLIAALLLLTTAHILIRSWRGQAWGWGSRPLTLALALCLGWLACGVARDWMLGPQQGRVPALSAERLAHAGALLGAAILGAAYCNSTGALRTACRGLMWLGVVLAGFALAQVSGHDVKVLAGWELISDRACGLYTNANRFAVLLCCCWMCAAAVLLESFTRRARPTPALRLERAVLVAAALVISAALALTLSRLTLVAMAFALGLAACLWLLLTRRRPGEYSVPVTPFDTIKRTAVLALPVLVVTSWGTWCLFVGATPMRSRLAALDTELTLGSRVLAMKAAWPLLLERPVWGWGLGSFESVFTTVQPATLPGRWRYLHNDWLQLGIEVGIPAAALTLALFGIWCRSVWRNIRADAAGPENGAGPLLRILPACGVLVPVLCSVADYPLREPATAALVFFLAGALCARNAPPAAQPATGARQVYRLAGVLLAVPLLMGGWLAGRNGLAYARSPWLWQIACPVRNARHVEAWETAVRTDPSDPELHFRLATSAFAASGGDKARLAAARQAVRQAAALQPYDHRFAWVEAAIAERMGETEEAFRLRELAATWAPGKPALREENGRLYLRYGVLPAAPGEPLRDWGLEHALENFRIVLQALPGREAEVIRAMDDAGCLNSEIAMLWPGQSERARLRRARFYCDRGQWDGAERELADWQPAGDADARWYHAILGTIDIRRGALAGGRLAWKRAIAATATGYDSELDGWLGEQARELSAADCEGIAGELLPDLIHVPCLAGILARKLIDGRRWEMADRLLEQVAERSVELSVLWAELALQMGDFAMAGHRARLAWEKDFSAGQWYEQFLKQLKQRQEEKL